MKLHIHEMLEHPSVHPYIRPSQNLKLQTSNFIHRYVTSWRSAVYKNHNSIPTILRVIALCKFYLGIFVWGITSKV